jgi:hypothetical protein
MNTTSTPRSQPQDPKWVSTGPAARALKVPVHPNTLWRWLQEGIVEPAGRTAKGQARWDVADLQLQIDNYLALQQEQEEQAHQARVAHREQGLPPPRINPFSQEE